MTDPTAAVQHLQALIETLDPQKHDVAIAHLGDAVEALLAVEKGRPTRYALNNELVDGQVNQTGKVRLFK